MTVPSELKQLNQWLVWRWEKTEKGRWTKPPYRADGKGHASSTDPSTWTPCRPAFDKWKSREADGLGFVVTENDPYCGIDLDHCRDANTGAIEDWAQAIVDEFNSYTEVTPSNTGLRIWIKAVFGGDDRDHKYWVAGSAYPDAAIEIYDRGRYFTITGHDLAGSPQTIREAQTELDTLSAALWPPKASPQAYTPPASGKPAGGALGQAQGREHGLTAEEVIETAGQAQNGDRFNRLMAGDTSDYGSASEADLALANIVAFYTQDWGIALQVISSSGLWDKKWEREDYQKRTLGKALEELTEKYESHKDLKGGRIVHSAPSSTKSSNGHVDPNTAEEILEDSSDLTAWPDPPDDAAYHGLASRVCDLIDPFSEADSVAILCQFLTAFGVACGRQPEFWVGATRHMPALFIALVGPSARGRKGSAWDPVEALFDRAEPTFGNRIFDGVGSGEKLIHLVHDVITDKNGKVIEEAVSDKRLLLQSSELSHLLTVVNREGSTMSQVLRFAFDGKPLFNQVKKDPAVSHGYHIGLIGHVTPEELRNKLTADSISNGLANRVAFFMTRRAKKLPDPPVFKGQGVYEISDEIKQKLQIASGINEMRRDKEAQDLWEDWYMSLSDESVGTVGALTVRAEAHVNRFSQVYALTDASDVVELWHLQAALALWDYCCRSAQFIFGEDTGDPIADRILKELRDGSLTRTEIYNDIFYRNLQSFRIDQSLKTLLKSGRITSARVKKAGPGRPVDRFELVSRD